MDAYTFATTLRVRFADTDAQGVAHNTSYLVWFEVARVEYLRAFVGGYQTLRDRGIGTILSEGGPHLFGSLTAADLVEEVCLTVSSLLAGPGAGRITAGPPSGVRDLALAHVLCADDALLLRYVRP